MTCSCCGYTVDGYACLGRDSNEQHRPSDPPRPFRQAGVYERVWCSYRWSCTKGCSLIHSAPEKEEDRTYDCLHAFLCCLSTPECDADQPERYGREMVPWEWIETLGPPSNENSFKCVRLEDFKPSNRPSFILIQ